MSATASSSRARRARSASCRSPASIARRIVCFVAAGRDVSAPAIASASSASARASTSICRTERASLVGVGARAVAGETVIADLALATSRARSFGELSGDGPTARREARFRRPTARGRRGGRAGFRRVPFAHRSIPNLVTLLALCLGLTAIRFAVGGPDFEWAVCAIAAAAMLDGLDGRIARALKRHVAVRRRARFARRFRRFRRRAGAPALFSGACTR